MNYYEFNCARCGGFVGEPMKAYGYAGQWCHCAEPQRPEGNLVSVITSTSGTEPTNIEKAIETALAKCTNEEGLVDIGKYDHDLLKEIVTSTYLQAVEACIELSDKIELSEPDGGTKQWMAFKRFRNTMRDQLQSLKQTKGI